MLIICHRFHSLPPLVPIVGRFIPMQMCLPIARGRHRSQNGKQTITTNEWMAEQPTNHSINQSNEQQLSHAWPSRCNLSQVSRRHMVFARFRQPINMGEYAHQVRLFVLVVVPTKQKSTKDQVETGRTFASMLTDSSFRHRLLQARSENEFKSLIMAKAQQMACAARIKNRHKYRLDPVLNESISSVSLEERHCKSINSELLEELELTTVAELIGPAAADRAPKAADDDHQAASGLKARPAFNRNPRTSKLFELISGPTTKEAVVKRAELEQQQSEVAYIETGKLSDLKRKRGDTGCCRLSLLGHRLVFGRDAWQDFKRRLKCYPSDFKDAFVGPPRTIQKTVATIWFLYFGILLPTIAFSSLNTVQTHGHMGDLRKAIIGQAIGGLGFALLGGQPLVIIMTTAPLCLYTKVIHQMCLDYGFSFPAMYAAVGLWNGLFLTIYSFFGFSHLMKWCTRSTEEVFALFIVVAFVTDAGKDMAKSKLRRQ
jgi:hypothetical protein